MAKDSREKSGIHRIAQQGDDGEEDEEADVEDEENDGYDLEPVAIVRELMEQGGHDASAHCDNEPATPQGSLNQRMTFPRAFHDLALQPLYVRGNEISYNPSESVIIRIIVQLDCRLLLVLKRGLRRIRHMSSRACAWLFQRPRSLPGLCFREDKVVRVEMLRAGPVVA